MHTLSQEICVQFNILFKASVHNRNTFAQRGKITEFSPDYSNETKLFELSGQQNTLKDFWCN